MLTQHHVVAINLKRVKELEEEIVKEKDNEKEDSEKKNSEKKNSEKKKKQLKKLFLFRSLYKAKYSIINRC